MAPEPSDRSDGCLIKGNISKNVDRIYHVLDSPSYDNTRQKQCNCTRLVPLPHNPDRAPHDARSAEVRLSQQRGCAGSARPGITAAREEFPWIR